MKPLEKASVYAALVLLKRLDDNNQLQLDPGTYNVSGKVVTIKLPPNTTIERAEGENKDGIVRKAMTQNLYGWVFLAVLAKILKKFNQWNTMKRYIRLAVAECLTQRKTLKEVLADRQNDDDFNLEQEIESLKKEVQLPKRAEPTPRQFKSENDEKCVLVVS